MTQPAWSEHSILRRKRVEVETGWGRSTVYARIAEGLFTKPVKLGPRARGWPAREVAALNEARIAAMSEDDIRSLVLRLEADRRTVLSRFTKSDDR
jgi:prophage regulatory protein